MALQPFFRSPLTDLTACLVNHQSYSKCAQFEMDMTECMEAYGLELGTKRCKDLIDDFHECTTFDKQTFRIFAMDVERKRQYRAGERDTVYAPPPRMDAY